MSPSRRLHTALSYWTNGEGAKAPPSMMQKVWTNAGTLSSLEAVDQAHPFPPELPTDELPRWATSSFERFCGDTTYEWNLRAVREP